MASVFGRSEIVERQLPLSATVMYKHVGNIKPVTRGCWGVRQGYGDSDYQEQRCGYQRQMIFRIFHLIAVLLCSPCGLSCWERRALVRLSVSPPTRLAQPSAAAEPRNEVANPMRMSKEA